MYGYISGPPHLRVHVWLCTVHILHRSIDEDSVSNSLPALSRITMTYFLCSPIQFNFPCMSSLCVWPLWYVLSLCYDLSLCYGLSLYYGASRFGITWLKNAIFVGLVMVIAWICFLVCRSECEEQGCFSSVGASVSTRECLVGTLPQVSDHTRSHGVTCRSHGGHMGHMLEGLNSPHGNRYSPQSSHDQ